MATFTDLDTFKKYIKTIPKVELDQIFDELTEKCLRARSPARKLGYALMLDECVIEAQMRMSNSIGASNLSIEELLIALGIVIEREN